MSDDICRLEHRTDPDRERPAWVGHFCRGHADGLWRTLNELSTFAGQADRASYDETVSAGMSAPTTGTKDKPLPYNDRRADHVIQVRGVLASWTQLIAEERGVAVPDSPDPHLTSGFLRRHLEWACGQEWAEEFAGEVFDLGRRAWSLLNPSGVRRIDIGPCREEGCTGQLSALVRKSDDFEQSRLICNTCQVEVTADRWLTYGRAVRGEAA